MDDIYEVAKLGISVGVVDLTLTRAPIFRPIRNWVDNQSDMLGALVKCPYCMGHWLGFLAVAVYRPRLFHGWWLLDYFLTALVITWIAVICASLAFMAVNQIFSSKEG